MFREVELESIRVLVVEDEPSDFALIERMLGRLEGFNAQITLASNLVAAQAAANENQFDAALVDFYVCGQCGLDLVPQLMSKGTNCAPILLTGELTPAVQRHAIKAGVLASLPKDKLDPRLLETVIRHALRNRQLLARLFSCLDELAQSRSEKTNLAANFMGLVANSLEQVVNGAAGVEQYVMGEEHRAHLAPQVRALSCISSDLKTYCRDTSRLLSRLDDDDDAGGCVDLQALLVDAVRLVDQRKTQRQIEIGMALLDHPVRVGGNATVLLRALVDLILACLAHVMPKGRLEIKVAMEDNQICLGIGSLQFCSRPDTIRLGGALGIARSRALLGQYHGTVQIMDTPNHQQGYVALVRLPRERRGDQSGFGKVN